MKKLKYKSGETPMIGDVISYISYGKQSGTVVEIKPEDEMPIKFIPKGSFHGWRSKIKVHNATLIRRKNEKRS